MGKVLRANFAVDNCFIGDKTHSMILRELIRNYRNNNRISLRELSDRIGVHFCALQRFELGKEVEARQFLKILFWTLEESNHKRPTVTRKVSL